VAVITTTSRTLERCQVDSLDLRVSAFPGGP